MNGRSGVTALGYLMIAASNLDAWERFAADVLGLPTQRRDDGVDIRLDDQAIRIRIIEGAADDILAAGWEVVDQAACAAVAGRLEQAGALCTMLTPEETRARSVTGGMRFLDPEGTTHELYWGPQPSSPTSEGRYGARFRTGDQGLGHIVLACRDKAALIDFFERTLGLRISDHIETEIVSGRTLSLSFLRCNSRHHSLALAQIAQKKKLVHLMVETLDIDDVGSAMSRCEAAGVHLSMTLGRHSNDRMLSFYALTPSGFDLEFGWGGLAVDEADWRVVVHDRTSTWGHHFRRPPKPLG